MPLWTTIVLSTTPLEEARQLHVELRYDAALARVDRALSGPNDRAELIGLYELQGLLHASLGRPARAKESYARLLMIEPGHELSASLAPRLRAPFEAARHEYGAGGWLEASERAPSLVTGDQPIVIEIRLANDPLGMVDRFRVTFAVGDAAPAAREVPASALTRVGLEVERAADSSGELTYWCALLDRHGGELYTLHGPSQPGRIRWQPAAALEPPAAADPAAAALAPLAAPGSRVESNRPWKSPWLWAAAAVTLVAGVGIAAYALSRPAEVQSCGSGAITCDRLD